MMGKSLAAFGWTTDFTNIEAIVNSACWRIRNFVDILLAWHERARQRRVLWELDDRMLKDIGITRAHAVREANKPFWRP